MKRTIALIVALLLCAIPALAQTVTTVDIISEPMQDGSLLLTFEEVSLRLPGDWKGRVYAVAETNGIALYQAASYEKYRAVGIEGGGFLFRISASVNSSFSELPSFLYLGFSEDSAMNYYLELPSDYTAYNESAIRADYDAMFAQIDEIAESAAFAADAEDGGIEWTVPQVRYVFEHRLLPGYFFEVPEQMMSVVSSAGVYPLWASLSTGNGVDPTYPADEYITHLFTADDGTLLAQVELPEPDDNTLCFRIYFIYNEASALMAYFTVESDTFSPDVCFVCQWTQDGTHKNYGAKSLMDEGEGHAAALVQEAGEIAALAGVAGALSPVEASVIEPTDLRDIDCPELGFSTKADPAYAWNYQQGTGISIYTESEGRIPYVTVFRTGDKLGEPFEFLREQYTPHMREQYGEALVSSEEVEAYQIGGKTLPAGLYTYRVQEYLVDLVRIYDTTGEGTAIFSAKFLQGEGEATLAALDTAIRYYAAE